MASSTRSHSSSNSEPGTSSKTGRPSSVRISTVCPRRARTAPEPSSTNSVVVTENSRCPPSSWADGGAQDQRPQRPRVVGQPVARGLGHDLELVHRGRALAVGRAEAVRPGVAATDDDDALALGVDGRRAQRALLDQVGGLQVLQGQVDPVEVASGHRQVTRQGGAAGEDDRVEGGLHLGGRAHGDVGRAGRPECRAPRRAP